MSDERRWRAGQEFQVSGLKFRIVRGVKDPDDLRLDVLASGGWIKVPFLLPAFLADFFYENEEVLYHPSDPRYIGGRKYLGHLATAGMHGWSAAQEKLTREKREKRRRNDEDAA